MFPTEYIPLSLISRALPSAFTSTEPWDSLIRSSQSKCLAVSLYNHDNIWLTPPQQVMYHCHLKEYWLHVLTHLTSTTSHSKSAAYVQIYKPQLKWQKHSDQAVNFQYICFPKYELPDFVATSVTDKKSIRSSTYDNDVIYRLNKFRSLFGCLIQSKSKTPPTILYLHEKFQFEICCSSWLSRHHLSKKDLCYLWPHTQSATQFYNFTDPAPLRNNSLLLYNSA